MNLLQVQTYFNQACLTYAMQYGKINDINNLWTGHFVENKSKKSFDDPPHYTVIDSWFHESKQPTNEDLMKFTVDQVLENFKMLLDQQQKTEDLKRTEIIVFKIPKVTNEQRQLMKNWDLSLDDGDLIYNKSTKRLEILINGKWDVVSMKSDNWLG